MTTKPWQQMAPLAGALAIAFGANAQSSADGAATDRVVVTATRAERNALDVPAAVSVVTGEQVRDAQLRENLSESLGRVPGLVLLNRQNYAQDLQLSIRGFGARSSFGERGVRLIVDGVPATLPDGQGQVSNFPLEAADRIEVLRGPFSALYGNSSGGVVSLTTELKAQPPRFTPTYARGSNGTWRLGFNGTGGSGSNAFNVDASRFLTEGARGHSAARRDLVNVDTAMLDTPAGELRIALNAMDAPDVQDVLGLTRAQFQAQPMMASPTAVQFNTRKSSRQETLGTTLQSNLGAAKLDTSVWIGARSVTQFQAIPVVSEASPTSPGGMIDFDRHFGGADLRATVERSAWTGSAGVDVERMDEARRGYNNYVGTAAAPTLGVQGTRRRDDTNVVQSFGPYAQAEAHLGSDWRLLAGVRDTRVNFESTSHLQATYTSIGYAALQPTAGVVYRATPRSSLYLSYGRGFETPTLNELAYTRTASPCTAAAGLNTALRASTSNNFEFGAKANLPAGLHAELALFTTRTSNDLRVLCSSGGRTIYANADQTQRDGAEATVDWQPSPRWSFVASAAAIDARFTAGFLTCTSTSCTTAQTPVPAGNKLPAIPARTAYTEIKYRADLVDLTLETRAQSAMQVNDTNSDHAAGFGVVNLALAHTFALGSTRPRLFGRIDNVFDRGYAGSVIVNDTNSRFFEAAPGRTWLVGVDWRL